MSDMEKKLKSENEVLKKANEELKTMMRGYENVLKLNEKELENAEEIKNMYELIVEFTRNELIQATETAKAQETASEMSRDELINAFNRITELDAENVELRKKKSSS